MKVRFWGTRGSVPVAGPSTLKYGGNTACIELRTSGGGLIVLDCGTGIRQLGRSLVSSAQGPIVGHIFLSHTHWDHIQGFPFFTPAFAPGNEFTIYGPRGSDKKLEEVLAGQLEYVYSPVTLNHLKARIMFQELGEGTLQIGEALISSLYLNHTSPALGYRIQADGNVVAYCTDNEPHSKFFGRAGDVVGTRETRKRAAGIVHEGDRRLVSFVHGADLLIHDAQYTAAEYADKVGWGHSSADYALDVALAAGVKRLALFHHDPDHDDEMLASIESYCRSQASSEAPALMVFAAAEGGELVLEGQETEKKAIRPRLLIAEDDELIVTALGYALSSDGYELLVARDGKEAIAKATAERPDLILLDVVMPGADGYQVCRALRSAPLTRDIPIIMLTARDEEGDTLKGFQEGADDYVTKPFAIPQLRARVRTWLLRTGKLAGNG